MKKIRIISNPYTKDTTFQVYDSDNNDWQNITIETDPNSKLISDEINKSFFPFKAKEIITYIVKEYGIGEDALEIVFKGTLDHFNEVEKICELLDTKCNITLTHDEVYLKNADGSEVHCLGNIAFWDENRIGSYEEYIFDVSPEDDLSDYTVWGYFDTCDMLTTGYWEVAFPIENKK